MADLYSPHPDHRAQRLAAFARRDLRPYVRGGAASELGLSRAGLVRDWAHRRRQGALAGDYRPDAYALTDVPRGPPARPGCHHWGAAGDYQRAPASEHRL